MDRTRGLEGQVARLEDKLQPRPTGKRLVILAGNRKELDRQMLELQAEDVEFLCVEVIPCSALATESLSEESLNQMTDQELETMVKDLEDRRLSLEGGNGDGE